MGAPVPDVTVAILAAVLDRPARASKREGSDRHRAVRRSGTTRPDSAGSQFAHPARSAPVNLDAIENLAHYGVQLANLPTDALEFGAVRYGSAAGLSRSATPSITATSHRLSGAHGVALTAA